MDLRKGLLGKCIEGRILKWVGGEVSGNNSVRGILVNWTSGRERWEKIREPEGRVRNMKKGGREDRD